MGCLSNLMRFGSQIERVGASWYAVQRLPQTRDFWLIDSVPLGVLMRYDGDLENSGSLVSRQYRQTIQKRKRKRINHSNLLFLTATRSRSSCLQQCTTTFYPDRKDCSCRECQAVSMGIAVWVNVSVWSLESIYRTQLTRQPNTLYFVTCSSRETWT